MAPVGHTAAQAPQPAQISFETRYRNPLRLGHLVVPAIALGTTVDAIESSPGLRRAGCPVDGSLYGAADQLAVTRDEPPKTLPSKG
jgi:hypothetical protein